MQEHTVTGRIVRLAIFSVQEFGTRASFTIDELDGSLSSAPWKAMSLGISLAIIPRATRS